MKIEALGVLSCLCLTGTSGAQKRKAPAYPLIMHNINKAGPQRQCGGLFEQIQYKF